MIHVNKIQLCFTNTVPSETLYAYKYIHLKIYSHIHTQKYTHSYSCVYIHVIFKYICIMKRVLGLFHGQVSSKIVMHTNTFISKCTYLNAHICMYIHTNVYIFTYTYIIM